MVSEAEALCASFSSRHIFILKHSFLMHTQLRHVIGDLIVCVFHVNGLSGDRPRLPGEGSIVVRFARWDC